GFGGCGLGVSLGFGGPGCYGGGGYYGYAPAYAASVYAAPVYSAPVYATAAYATPVYTRTPAYVAARPATYTAPFYAKAVSPPAPTVALVTYAPAQVAQAW